MRPPTPHELAADAEAIYPGDTIAAVNVHGLPPSKIGGPQYVGGRLVVGYSPAGLPVYVPAPAPTGPWPGGQSQNGGNDSLSAVLAPIQGRGMVL